MCYSSYLAASYLHTSLIPHCSLPGLAEVVRGVAHALHAASHSYINASCPDCLGGQGDSCRAGNRMDETRRKVPAA